MLYSLTWKNLSCTCVRIIAVMDRRPETNFAMLKIVNILSFDSDSIMTLQLQLMRLRHRYLISRLSLQVFYLWRHVLSTSPPFILWWSNIEILFAPLHRSSPFIGGLRCQALQTEHGPYIAERTQEAVYIVRYLWATAPRLLYLKRVVTSFLLFSCLFRYFCFNCVSNELWIWFCQNLI
jgi:hypothetical protein